MKYRFIPPFIITLFLFFTPFFWFKPGEMDLGGDSSRLYFYDPLHYLASQAIYAISHSGLGGEGLNYFGIPFFLLLAGLKSIFESPTILIAFIHGFSLSLAFLSCYLIVKQLLFQKEERRIKYTTVIIEICALIAGLYYVSAPVSILIWNHMLLTDNQIFLNPLIFFLLLKYLLTRNMRYMIVILGITFLFAANFSVVGSPAFFAFYPLAFLFLMFYTVYVVHKPLPWKGIVVGVVLFFLLHAFHLVPVIESLLTPGSPANNSIFSQGAKLDSGLGYFNAIAPGVKPSISLLGLMQTMPLNFFSFVFIIFPVIFLLGFLWNRKKSMLLTGVFFLIAFFFATANITTIGLNFYRLLFHVPGFSMFRVFFGQWMWIYLFFYTLLLGQSLAIVLTRIKKSQGIFLALFLIGFLIIIAWPFISGKTLRYIHWQTKGVSAIVAMDPEYEKVLAYLRSLPIDGKILSLPLSDPGYQTIKGVNNAAYEGPSTITYLAGRNEFMGFVEFESFGPSFLRAAQEKNYVAIRDMLAMLNIRYIYYNEDPYIYGKNFPGQPYIQVSNFLPDTQQGYKEFIKNLGVKEIKTIAGKYHIYEFDDTSYLPHIYAAGKTAYWNDNLVNLYIPLSFYLEDKRIALYNDQNFFIGHRNMFDDIFFKATNNNPLLEFFKERKASKFASPYVSQRLSSVIYPLVVLKERISLALDAKLDDKYFEESIFFAEKRINELEKWIGEVPVLGNVKSIEDLGKTWKDPAILEFTKYSQYNSWEVTLARYQKEMFELIKKINGMTKSVYSPITNKVTLRNTLVEHRKRLKKLIAEDYTISFEKRKYLLELSRQMFDAIFNRLDLQIPDCASIPYAINNLSIDGNYEVYVDKQEMKDLEANNYFLTVNGKKILPRFTSLDRWIQFDDVNLENKSSFDVKLNILSYPNLVAKTTWRTLEGNKISTDSVTLKTEYIPFTDTSGLVDEIAGWGKELEYIISFDYVTYGKNFKVTMYEEGEAKSKYFRNMYEETLYANSWKKFSTTVKSGKEANSAFIQITKAAEDLQDALGETDNFKKIEIKNLSVVRIPDPRIILKKVVRSKEELIPQIIFTEINPTKYKVTVHGAKDPYVLVLSQRFNAKWKLFLPNGVNEAKSLKGLISKILGKIISSILQAKNIVISSEASKGTLTSYFNDDVTEEMHKNIFLDKNTFETFGQDPILEKTHLPVNGYANAWYIRPEDVRNKENYELIIEMTSQKLFYVSLLTSLVGLLLLVFLLLKSLIRK